MTNLLPCPFCGGEGKIWAHDDGYAFAPGCINTDCLVFIAEATADYYPTTQTYASAADAIYGWNRRAPALSNYERIQPMTDADAIIAFIRAQGVGITPRAGAIIRSEIDKAIKDAERGGMKRAANLCRMQGERRFTAMADELDALIDEEQSNAR